MSKKNIILTGFMATGKTTVGKLLAKDLGYEFVDTDHVIEARNGMTVAEIFRDKGEGAFREMESALARELSEREGLVISTGGRMMLDPGNAAALSRSGRVFCLVATPEDILERVKKDSGVRRPLLEVPNPIERIVELMEQRKEGYGRFPQMVTTDKTPGQVTQNLTGIYKAPADLRVPITVPRAEYEYIVGGGLLPFVTQLAGIGGPVAVVTDSDVGQLYGQSCGQVDAVITVPPGGGQKTLATVQHVAEQLVEKGFDRSVTIIALGGSVISGLAGFVAATYMRGVDCVQCPTSLLAMVDTSIGGKAGINLPQGKNLIGAFKQPKAVIADVATLQSLAPRDFASGMAEVIKHSLIADSDLLDKIESGYWKHEPGMPQARLADLQALVAQAIQVKINIVQEDPFEHGKRTVLNLGHTFAHAIEQASGHAIRHGEAVALGMVASANLSSRLGYCPDSLQNRIEGVLSGVGLPIRIPETIGLDGIVTAMSSDKKRKAGRMRFVLPREIGDVFICDEAPPESVRATLEELLS